MSVVCIFGLNHNLTLNHNLNRFAVRATIGSRHPRAIDQTQIE